MIRYQIVACCAFTAIAAYFTREVAVQHNYTAVNLVSTLSLMLAVGAGLREVVEGVVEAMQVKRAAAKAAVKSRD